MKVIVENKTEKNISVALFVQFAVLTIQYFLLYYFHVEESGIGTLIKLMSKITVGIFFLVALKDVFEREYKLIIITYGISIIIFLFNILLFPQNIESIKSIIFDFFFMCLPCFVYSYSVSNYAILYKTFEKVSNLVFVMGLLISLLDFLNKIDVGTYSMTLSYYLLMPSLLYLYKFLNEVSVKYFIAFLLSFISILLLGSRGPILCIAVYTITYLINNIRGKSNIKKMVFYFIAIIILLISIIFFKNILYILNQILENFNIYSRTVALLLDDDIHLSGRENLYSGAFELIKQHPILGIGIAGDRYYFGGYVHNIFLEIVLNFGCFFGLLLLLLLISIFIKSIFFINRNMLNFILIFFCLGAVPLMISGSYLISAWFWIFIGISIKYIFITNKN